MMMSKNFKIVSVYCASVFLALLALIFWPANTDRLLVVVPGVDASQNSRFAQSAHQYIFAALANTDARVVGQVGDQSFIVATTPDMAAGLAKILYENGAYIVVNAQGDFGCSGKALSPSFRSAGA